MLHRCHAVTSIVGTFKPLAAVLPFPLDIPIPAGFLPANHPCWRSPPALGRAVWSMSNVLVKKSPASVEMSDGIVGFAD